MPCQPDELCCFCHCPADDEIILPRKRFRPCRHCCDIVQAGFRGDSRGYPDLLGNGVNQGEFNVREEYGKRYSRESSASADINDGCARREPDETGNGEGVKQVVNLEVVDILSGNDIDFVVPLPVYFRKE